MIDDRRLAIAPGHVGGHIVDGEKGRGGGAATGKFFNDQAGIEARQLQPARPFGGIHPHETQFASLAQDVFRKQGRCIPMRGIRRQGAFGKCARAINEGPLLLGQGEIHG